MSAGHERLSSALHAGGDGRPGVIAYVTAGFPQRESTVELLLACQRAGCAAVEVGIPFSDPMADGPVIQHTSHLALLNGMRLPLALEQVAQAREQGLTLPVAVMTYVNPLLAVGLADFVESAAAHGVDGVIIPDLPAGEASEIASLLGAAGLAHVPLVAPTTPQERIARIVERASGFVYCVSVTGTTGARDRVGDAALALLERVRAATPLPRALGFGISRPEHVESLRGRCEAVVVGSALLQAVGAVAGGDPVAAAVGVSEGAAGAAAVHDGPADAAVRFLRPLTGV